jgi:hypothetical protein
MYLWPFGTLSRLITGMSERSASLVAQLMAEIFFFVTITVTVLAGLIISLILGAVVAGLVLMEHHRRMVVYLRSPSSA